MNNTKPTASTDKNRNDSMMMIRLLAVGYILYMLYDTIKMFIAGGEDAPSVLVLILSIVILGGGAVAVLIFSWKQYRKNKQEIEQHMAEARAQAAMEEEAVQEDALQNEDACTEESAQQDTL